jgi:hypothetical protein
MTAAPAQAAVFAALSAIFPDGEKFFVRSVKRFESATSGILKEDVSRFIRQESHHMREHVAFNWQAASVGMPLEPLTERTRRHIRTISSYSGRYQLALTLALEHLTAVFAHQILRSPVYLEWADDPTRSLWRWHAVEEIEHKCVAYDLFMDVMSDRPALTRFAMRSWAIIEAALRLSSVTWLNIVDLTNQQTGSASTRRKVLVWLFMKPGLLWSMMPDLLGFFRPGFHPSSCSDEEALNAGRSSLDAELFLRA